MEFRIACHLCGWPNDVVSDHRRVMQIVRDAGYDGVEGFGAKTADELVEIAALAAEHGLHLVNFGGPDPTTKARFNATLGNDAAEVPAQWKGNQELDDAALQAKLDALKPAIADFAALGLKPFHHIHVGTILETADDCARVLAALPELWLLFDTGHLLAANSDPMDVLARWPKQIGHVHLKNFWTQDPKAGWDRHKPDFWKTSRFCDLAEGNTGLDVGAVLAGLAQAGYEGWIAVEEDHPRRDIAAVARDNREFLRKLGC
jgi:sugar phosphate isomerase/epimerase